MKVKGIYLASSACEIKNIYIQHEYDKCHNIADLTEVGSYAYNLMKLTSITADQNYLTHLTL